MIDLSSTVTNNINRLIRKYKENIHSKLENNDASREEAQVDLKMKNDEDHEHHPHEDNEATNIIL